MSIYEEENVELRYNVTDIDVRYFSIDPDMFFLRSENKYGLYELNVEKISLNMSLNYDFFLVPPILADEGSVDIFFQDLSVNVVWNLDLNSTKNFFDVKISHVLIMVDPENFSIDIKGHSDLAELVNQELKLLIKHGLNEFLTVYRKSLADLVQRAINLPGKVIDALPLDELIPYQNFVQQEKQNLTLNIKSDQQPVIEQNFIQIFMNMSVEAPGSSTDF